MGVSTEVLGYVSDARRGCVLVTDGDGSLNVGVRTAPPSAQAVRPRHRRGWESQRRSPARRGVPSCVRPRHRRGWESQQHGGQGIRARRRASSSPTGMGVSTRPRRPSCRRRSGCVLVTDGDGSLNEDERRVDDHGPVGASSSPTGMGVSTPSIRFCVTKSRQVRPRHRRGWESQPVDVAWDLAGYPSASSSPTGMGVSTAFRGAPDRAPDECVLVTDGDGSLNDNVSVSQLNRCLRASSSPTGMGVSTSNSATISGNGTVVRPRHRRGWESQLR